jgi:cellulose synthase/poly-beta-1,6-N-acetylglucosamine synthase-like glycosyltransferase
LILHLLFLKGYFQSLRTSKLSNTPQYPVTVIIAAKNEESSIVECIESLKKLNYPKSLLEIILVNDKSIDQTRDIIEKNIEGFDYFTLLDSNDENVSNLKGKANAIDTGINNSKGRIIFTTDADCSVPVNWIEETLKYYDKDSVAMVCGFTNIKESGNIFSILQTLDWIYLLSLASGSSGISKILSCIGNNLSFRKEVYQKIGGYKSIKFSITEDLALMRKIDSDKYYIVKFPVNKDCVVKTNPCSTIKEFYLQKKRWFKGGIGVNYLGYIMAIELYIMNLILLLGLIFLNPIIYCILILIKIFSELLIFLPVYRTLGVKYFLIYFPIFQIFFGVYGLLLPISFIFGHKITWKGRKY